MAVAVAHPKGQPEPGPGGILPRPFLARLLLVGTASGLPGRCPLQSQPCISPLRLGLLPVFSLQQLSGCEGQRRVVWERRPRAWHAPCTRGSPGTPSSLTVTQSQEVQAPGNPAHLPAFCRVPGRQKGDPRSRGSDDSPPPPSPPPLLSWGPHHSPMVLKTSVTWWFSLAEVSMNSNFLLSANSFPS